MLRGVALALVLIEGVAWADDPLVRARQAVGESDYVAARGALVAAREAGGCSPEQTVERALSRDARSQGPHTRA